MPPYEAWYGRKHLRVFGCLAFVHVPDECRKKLDYKSTAAISVCYSTTKQFRIYDPVAKKLHIFPGTSSHARNPVTSTSAEELEDRFVFIPLDTVLPTDRLPAQIHEPAGDVNLQ